MGKRLTKEQVIQRFKEVHGDKYDYSKVEYKNNSTKVCIICPKHGEFWQEPQAHFNGSGCRKCFDEKLSKQKTISIDDLEKRVNNRYQIIQESYINTKIPCLVKCLKCGNIWRTKFNDVLNSHNCPECARMASMHTQQEAIDILSKKYGNKFLFHKFRYNGSVQKVTLVCANCGREIAASFNRFLHGVKCPCSADYKQSKMESQLIEEFNKREINYVFQSTFEWLKNGCGQLKLDFYLPDYNIAIECQGKQHFTKVSFGEKKTEKIEENFVIQQERDKRKKELCHEHGVKLIYFLEEKYVPYLNEGDIYFTNIDDLIEYIKS